jgi:hypothetical protein
VVVTGLRSGSLSEEGQLLLYRKWKQNVCHCGKSSVE